MPFVLAGRPKISAGLRDKEVVIEQMSASVGPSGFPVETWSTLATVMMSREDLQADEHFAVAQESAFRLTQWHLAYQPEMDPDVVDVPATRRLNFQGRIYNIRSAVMIGQNRGVELITLAKAGA